MFFGGERPRSVPLSIGNMASYAVWKKTRQPSQVEAVPMDDFVRKLEGELGEIAMEAFCYNLWEGVCDGYKPAEEECVNRVECAVSGRKRKCDQCKRRDAREKMAEKRKVAILWPSTLLAEDESPFNAGSRRELSCKQVVLLLARCKLDLRGLASLAACL